MTLVSVNIETEAAKLYPKIYEELVKLFPLETYNLFLDAVNQRTSFDIGDTRNARTIKTEDITFGLIEGKDQPDGSKKLWAAAFDQRTGINIGSFSFLAQKRID